MLYAGTVWRLNDQNPALCSHRSAPSMSFSIRRILWHLHTHTLNPSVWIPVHWHTVQSISFQSVQFFSHTISEYPSQTVPIYLILKYWYAHIRYQLVGMRKCFSIAYQYAICLGIAHPISAYWYAECLGIAYQISPYWYAEYLGVAYQISPCWYAECLDINHQIPPYWYANACINKRLPIAAYHLADTHTRCQKISARWYACCASEKRDIRKGVSIEREQKCGIPTR